MNENLFELTKEAIETSKMMYNGKIIKCLVAPYHTYSQLEKEIPYSKTTYLFPERELPLSKLSSFISMLVESNVKEEIKIITTNQNIIMDMVDCCVRILNEKGDILDCPIKTFSANIHSIRYELLENPNHALSKKEKTHSIELINEIINEINSNKIENFKKTFSKIQKIGEPLIKSKLESDLSYKLSMQNYK
jgi:hypothetical protein